MKFRCKVCGYIHEGNAAPEKCPVCGVDSSQFVAEGAPEKKKFLGGKNNNAYIIFYSTVMVVVVAAILAFAAMSLKVRQDANELGEKKSAIMESMGSTDSYDDVVTAFVVDANGEVMSQYNGDAALQMLFNLPSAFEAGTLPVFENKSAGLYVIPVTGKGLWDDIWGYVALKSDMNTINGVVFSHAGETPGLGAELATPKFWNLFTNKTIFEGAQFVGISVVKGGAKEGDKHAVDALTGGTKTSVGIEKMIKDSFAKYVPFLQKAKSNSQNVQN